MPLCLNGRVPLHDLAYPKDAQKKIAAPDKEVPLVRIHLEEDVAKSFHFETSTGIDFNRAGTPLMEIVSAAGDRFAGGSVRLSHRPQANPDLRRRQRCRHGERASCAAIATFPFAPEAQTELGAKIEIKNMNSISGVRRALAYEVERQTEALAARARNSSRKRAAGTMPRARLFSCARRNRRTITVIFPIPIWCR